MDSERLSPSLTAFPLPSEIVTSATRPKNAEFGSAAIALLRSRTDLTWYLPFWPLGSDTVIFIIYPSSDQLDFAKIGRYQVYRGESAGRLRRREEVRAFVIPLLPRSTANPARIVFPDAVRQQGFLAG